MRPASEEVSRAAAPTEGPAAPRESGSPPAARRRSAILARESARKLVHVTSAVVAAILAWALPDAQRRALFVAVAAFALAFDLARLAIPGLHRRFRRALGPVLRGKEAGRITGATTLAIGFMAAVLLFPRPAAVAGLLYAGLADAMGALVGRAFGRHRYPGGRSLEGSLAFLVVASAIGWLLPGPGPAAGLAVALALTLLEAIPLPIDDNLLLPILGAALTFVASRLA